MKRIVFLMSCLLYVAVISASFADTSVNDFTYSYQEEGNAGTFSADLFDIDFAALYAINIDFPNLGHAVAHESRTHERLGFAVVNEARPPPDMYVVKISNHNFKRIT